MTSLCILVYLICITANLSVSPDTTALYERYIFTVINIILITFCVSRRRRKMYCGMRVCVCLSVAACLHYCTDPDVTWGSGRGCPLVVHYWADLQSVHGLHCYGNIRNAWQSPAVICHAHHTPHALRMPAKTPIASDNACCVHDVICNEAVPFRPYCGPRSMDKMEWPRCGVMQTRNVSEYMLELALCLVIIVLQ